MLKSHTKSILTIAMILCSAITLAIVENGNASNDETRFYGGIQLGYNNVDYDVDYPVSSGGSTSIDGDGWDGGLVLGMSRRLGSFYVGAELEANKSNVETVITENGIEDKTEMSNTFGVSAIGGYHLTPSTVIYARLGAVRSKFEGAGGDNYSKGGFRSGLGLQMSMTDSLSARAEYVHTNYSSINDGLGSVDPSSGLVRVGLLYNF